MLLLFFNSYMEAPEWYLGDGKLVVDIYMAMHEEVFMIYFGYRPYKGVFLGAMEAG